MNVIRLVLNSSEFKARFGPTCPDCGTRCERVDEAVEEAGGSVECAVCGAKVAVEAYGEVTVYDDDDASSMTTDSNPAHECAPAHVQTLASPPDSPSLAWDGAAATVLPSEPAAKRGKRGRSGANAKRLPKGMGWRSGHLAPMRDCPELTRASTGERSYKTQKRINGTVPCLVPMNAHRKQLIEAIHKKHGAAFATGGPEATPAEFQALLLEAGYSEGSVDPNNASKNRKDGCVYKYPGYMLEFFHAGVVACRADFFEAGAEQRAQSCAEAYGARKAEQARGYASMTREARQRLQKKHAMNLMHGFNTYVKLAVV
jgi:hypothetical protein